MSNISFIHLSDIHFVKSSNNPDDIDNDLRKAIIMDLKTNATQSLSNVRGILVTGDIAFSGSSEEYDIAKDYLNQICEIFSIKHSDVYCVPGNHDVNQGTINSSDFIPIAQNAIESASSIDDADKAFSKYIGDYNMSALFVPIDKYNDFARRFECDISSKRIFWKKRFELAKDFYFQIVGINSSFISNRTDHQKGKPDRSMYIGQAQIPDYIINTATLLMCHHPPECWKFNDEMLQRINKRADIQLYGHMHSQSHEITEENAILYSGAVHPTRTVDWLPRYNWLSIDGDIENNERILKIEIYPRCLRADRDSFTIDNVCGTGKNSIIHEINIDKKRASSLGDPQLCIDDASLDHPSPMPNDSVTVDEREIVYNFYELAWVKQIDILTHLSLISEEDKSLSVVTMLTNAISRAKEQDKLDGLHKKILKEINWRKNHEE